VRHSAVGVLCRHSIVEGLNCKRPIQCLASSKIWTPAPSPPGECVPPPPPPPRLWCRGEDTLAGWRGGAWGVNILEDARHCSVLYICKYFVHSMPFHLKLVFSLPAGGKRGVSRRWVERRGVARGCWQAGEWRLLYTLPSNTGQLQ
jgi:hypothetical protein